MKKSGSELPTHAELTEAFLYDPLTGHFTRRANRGRFKAGTRIGALSCDGRYKIYFKGKQHAASRLAWFYMTGEWPLNEIDHSNTIRHDDRWNNLREATSAQNNANKLAYNKPNATGFKGVQFKFGRFEAEICVNRKQVSLGYFSTAERAALARDMAAKKYHGEFARFNFPETAHRDWLVV